MLITAALVINGEKIGRKSEREKFCGLLLHNGVN